MAETNLLTFTVSYQGSRTVLHRPKNEPIGKAVQKAMEAFKAYPDTASWYTFLYHGLEITDGMTVGVSRYYDK